MNYKIKPGFVLLSICNTHILVAKRECWENNAVIRQMPPKYVLVWTLMEKGKTSNEAIQSISQTFHKTHDEVEKRFSSVIQSLAESGYLIQVEEKST